MAYNPETGEDDGLDDEFLDSIQSPGQISQGVVAQALKTPAVRPLKRIEPDYDAALRQQLMQRLTAAPPAHQGAPKIDIGQVTPSFANRQAVDESRAISEQNAGPLGGLIALQQPVLRGHVKAGIKANAFLDPQIKLLEEQAALPAKRLAAQKADDDAMASERLMRMLGQEAGLSPEQSQGLSGAGAKAPDVLGRLSGRQQSTQAKNEKADADHVAAQNKALEALLALDDRERQNKRQRDDAIELEKMRQAGANSRNAATNAARVDAAAKRGNAATTKRAAAQASLAEQGIIAGNDLQAFADELENSGLSGIRGGGLEAIVKLLGPNLGGAIEGAFSPKAAELRAQRGRLLERVTRTTTQAAPTGSLANQTGTLGLMGPTVPGLGNPAGPDVARETGRHVTSQAERLKGALQSGGYQMGGPSAAAPAPQLPAQIGSHVVDVDKFDYRYNPQTSTWQFRAK